jgi:hypothetical protein
MSLKFRASKIALMPMGCFPDLKGWTLPGSAGKPNRQHPRQIRVRESRIVVGAGFVVRSGSWLQRLAKPARQLLHLGKPLWRQWLPYRILDCELRNS